MDRKRKKESPTISGVACCVLHLRLRSAQLAQVDNEARWRRENWLGGDKLSAVGCQCRPRTGTRASLTEGQGTRTSLSNVQVRSTSRHRPSEPLGTSSQGVCPQSHTGTPVGCHGSRQCTGYLIT